MAQVEVEAVVNGHEVRVDVIDNSVRHRDCLRGRLHLHGVDCPPVCVCELVVIITRVHAEANVRKRLCVLAPVRDSDAEDSVMWEREERLPVERAHLDVQADDQERGCLRGLD